MAIELDDLSLDELKVLHARVAKAISSFVDRKKAAALKELLCPKYSPVAMERDIVRISPYWAVPCDRSLRLGVAGTVR